MRPRARERVSFVHHIIRGVVMVALCIAFVFGVYHGTRMPSFTISTITISGGETISHESIHAHLTSMLTGSYFGIIPKRFAYTYPQKTLEASFQKFPQVRSVEIERYGTQEIRVVFTEHIPHALWCLPHEGSPCYFLSESGFAFDEAPLLYGGALVRHVTLEQTSLARGQVVESSLLSEINWFIERVDATFNIRVASIVHRNDKDIEMRIHGGGFLLLTPHRDMHEAFSHLSAVLASPEYEHIVPGNFQYIDLRFGQKVFINEESNLGKATTTVE